VLADVVWVYVLNIDGGATIKRVEVADGRLVVSSDNLNKDRYPTYTRPIHGIDLRTIIVGEVVWIGRYMGSGKGR
jgi:phage repressor protein C with HTH and peptisase S24 domain